MPALGISRGMSSGKNTFCEYLREVLATRIFNADEGMHSFIELSEVVEETIGNSAVNFLPGADLSRAKNDKPLLGYRSPLMVRCLTIRSATQTRPPVIKHSIATPLTLGQTQPSAIKPFIITPPRPATRPPVIRPFLATPMAASTRPMAIERSPATRPASPTLRSKAWRAQWQHHWKLQHSPWSRRAQSQHQRRW
jgi:hypothetical protein